MSVAFLRSRISPGLTLLELIVAISLGILLVSLVVPIASTFIQRGKKVRCMSNMRTIHSGLLGYWTDKGRWPQMEEGRFNYSEVDFFRFWITETEPYGLSAETWVCPMDRAFERLAGEENSEFYASYVVTRFDEKNNTPFRWNQPWAIERGTFHGRGSHILMPDGSVSDSQSPFSGR